jgi:cell division protein FtsB
MDFMQDDKMQARTSAAGIGLHADPRSLTKRVREFVLRVWRPVASAVAVALAMLILWHGIIGKNGLLAWQQKRVESRELRKEIISLQQENALLSERIERLKSNPDAIGIVARGTRRYIKPNEVIVTLPPEPNSPAQPAGTDK